MNIQTKYELKKTAEFYGYYIREYVQIKPGIHEYGYSLVEVGSDIIIANWSGIDALNRAIYFCNWLFAQFENEERN